MDCLCDLALTRWTVWEKENCILFSLHRDLIKNAKILMQSWLVRFRGLNFTAKIRIPVQSCSTALLLGKVTRAHATVNWLSSRSSYAAILQSSKGAVQTLELSFVFITLNISMTCIEALINISMTCSEALNNRWSSFEGRPDCSRSTSQDRCYSPGGSRYHGIPRFFEIIFMLQLHLSAIPQIWRLHASCLLLRFRTPCTVRGAAWIALNPEGYTNQIMRMKTWLTRHHDTRGLVKSSQRVLCESTP